MATLTVTAALTQLKILDKKIVEDTNTLVLTTVVQGEQVVPGFRDNGEFASKAQSRLQSVLDLIKRRGKIKSALVNSNASTKITVGGTELTVAEAIELKNSIIYYQNLLSTMKNQSGLAKDKAERANSQVQNNLNTSLRESLKDVPVDQIEKLMELQLKKNLWSIIAPKTLESEIEKLDTFITNFLSEVDTALNVSNAVTSIEVAE